MPRSRLPGLDLLRAIAIVWVMLFHSFIVGGLGPHFAWLSRYGWAGVDIFFVLSGFLIGFQVLQPLQRGDPLSFRRFYARRAWRILPAFAVVLALYVLFPSLREVPGLAPWWQFVTFTLNLLIDYGRHPAFSHAWSLCVEEHFYLFFPLLAWWLARRPSRLKFAIVCSGVVLLGIALRTGVWLHDVTMDPPRNWFVEDIYYPTWMRLDGLLMGVMLATLRVYQPQRWARLQMRSGSKLIAAIAVSALALWMFRDRTGLLANALGWPVLSLGIVVGVCRSRPWQCDWPVGGTGRRLAGGHFLQSVSQSQDCLSSGAGLSGACAARICLAPVRGICVCSPAARCQPALSGRATFSRVARTPARAQHIEPGSCCRYRSAGTTSGVILDALAALFKGYQRGHRDPR